MYSGGMKYTVLLTWGLRSTAGASLAPAGEDELMFGATLVSIGYIKVPM